MGAHKQERELYGDHTLGGPRQANEARFGARARQRNGPRQSNPRLPPPGTLQQTRSQARPQRGPKSDLPPPRHPSSARLPQKHRPAQERAGNPEPGKGTKGPGHPPELIRRSTGWGSKHGGARTTQKQPYQSPATARGPRATLTRGRGARAAGARVQIHAAGRQRGPEGRLN